MQIRRGEGGVVEGVEKLETELEVGLFREMQILEQRGIPFVEPVLAQIPERGGESADVIGEGVRGVGHEQPGVEGGDGRAGGGGGGLAVAIPGGNGAGAAEIDVIAGAVVLPLVHTSGAPNCQV